MPFVISMVWREETDQISDLRLPGSSPSARFSQEKKNWTLCYPNIRSAMRPVRHGEDLPLPEPPDVVALESEKENDEICDRLTIIKRSRIFT